MAASAPQVIYKEVFVSSEFGPPFTDYTPHLVLRASPRFLWVSRDPLAFEGYYQCHPDTRQTYRLDRVRLERDGRLDRLSHRARDSWTLTPPPEAEPETEGRYRVMAMPLW